MKIYPYIYEPEKSVEVYSKTNSFLAINYDVKSKIESLGWVCHEVGNIIPQTVENYWSGHSFPFSESWNDLQISCTQAFFGLYKQAFVSLRSGLELGLLSVYYNINDDGHNVVRDWLESKDSREANTPRADKIWKILLSNNNIQMFNDKHDLRGRIDSLNYLHNYVHTKGSQFSNSFGGLKGNFQTFEENVFNQWLIAYEEVVIIIAAMHLLKYPLAVIEFDYFKKFGIDMPNFGGLEKFKLDKIAAVLPIGFMDDIKQIAATDELTQITLQQITAMPDLTDDQIEEQAIKVHKFSIEHGEGFIEWEKQQYDFMNSITKSETLEDNNKYPEPVLQRIEVLRAWATKNNFMESKRKRLGWK